MNISETLHAQLVIEREENRRLRDFLVSIREKAKEGTKVKPLSITRPILTPIINDCLNALGSLQ